MENKMQPGPGPDSVEGAIALLEAAKRMGVQTLRFGDFAFSFTTEAVAPGGGAYRQPVAPETYSSPFDDPDMWLHVQPEPPK